MATPEPIMIPAANLPTNVLSCMPSLQGKNSLHFRGKDIEGFLNGYEHYTIHANLMDKVKCKEIQIYFSKREKRVLDVLGGYQTLDWEDLKEQLRSLYMSSAKRKVYQPRDIQRYITKKRKISKLIHFNMY